MSQLESMTARVDRLERQLRATRAVSACAIAIAVGLGVVGACTHHEPAPIAPPTKIELRAPGGGPSVTIDPTGIVLENAKSTTQIAADTISASAGTQRAVLSASALEFPSTDGDTTLKRDSLSMTHGKHSITSAVADDGAKLILSSDGLRRAVEIAANLHYASVVTAFLPQDGLSPPHSGQLAADNDGGELTVSEGKVERSFSQKAPASAAGRK